MLDKLAGPRRTCLLGAYGGGGGGTCQDCQHWYFYFGMPEKRTVVKIHCVTPSLVTLDMGNCT